MERITIEFGKDKTAIIKGIAIILMIVLHCGKQEWFDTPIPAFTSYPWLSGWLSMGKLCVGIFAFLVGYGYAFAKKKDWLYSLNHIKKLLIPFWIILFVFTLPVVFFQENWVSWKVILLNLFGVNSEYCWVSWFVLFYIYAMMVMPFYSRIIDHFPIMGTILLIVASYGIELAVHSIPDWSNNDWTQRLFDCMINTPKMLIGYLMAHKLWYNKIKIPCHWGMACVALLIIILVFVARYKIEIILGFNLDFFYAPLFILAVLILFNLYKLPVLSNVLMRLGKTSVYMWFFHSLFFTGAVRSVYQPFILISNNLWIIIPWTILLTFLCSWVVKWCANYLQTKFSSYSNVI